MTHEERAYNRALKGLKRARAAKRQAWDKYRDWVAGVKLAKALVLEAKEKLTASEKSLAENHRSGNAEVESEAK